MLHFIIDLTYLAIQKLLFQPLLSLKSGFKAHSNVIRFHFAMKQTTYSTTSISS